MEEIVKIHETKQGQKVVSARDLHEKLGSKQDFSNWIKNRIEKYGFIEGEDYTSFDKIIERENGGTIRREYALTLNTAKEIAMVEGNERGRVVRKYFIECERLAIESSPTQIREYSKKELALMVIQAEEEKEALQAKIDMDAPKVKAAEIMLMSDDTITIAEFAKSIKKGPNKFHKKLRDDKVLIDSGNRHNLPYQRYIDAGYFDVKETSEVINNKVKLFHQTRITPKGQIYLTTKYA